MLVNHTQMFVVDTKLNYWFVWNKREGLGNWKNMQDAKMLTKLDIVLNLTILDLKSFMT